MASNSENKELLKRLEELEKENALLRKVTESSASKKLTVTEGEYKGHPTLHFEGSFHPFTLGLKKLYIIKEAWPQVESFLQRHSEELSGFSLSDDEDCKI